MEFDKQLKEHALKNNVPISFDETIKFVIDTINKYNCKNILEIGTAIAFGSISMAQNTNLTSIDTVEKDTSTYLIAKENVNKRGLQNKINCINMAAKDFLENCSKQYDFIYLDGPKGQYINYLPFLLKLLNKNGIIVADNIFFHGMVTGTTPVPASCRSMIKGLHKFIEEITTNKNLESNILNIGDGIALIKKI